MTFGTPSIYCMYLVTYSTCHPMHLPRQPQAEIFHTSRKHYPGGMGYMLPANSRATRNHHSRNPSFWGDAKLLTHHHRQLPLIGDWPMNTSKKVYAAQAIQQAWGTRKSDDTWKRAEAWGGKRGERVAFRYLTRVTLIYSLEQRKVARQANPTEATYMVTSRCPKFYTWEDTTEVFRFVLGHIRHHTVSRRH